MGAHESRRQSSGSEDGAACTQDNEASLHGSIGELVRVHGLGACQAMLAEFATARPPAMPVQHSTGSVDSNTADEATPQSQFGQPSSWSKLGSSQPWKLLSESSKLMEAMLNASFDSMLIVDEMGSIVTANQAALEEFGYNSEELIGKNINVIVGGIYAEHHDRYMEKFRETRVTRIIGTQREVPAKRKDGSEFPCILGIEVIDQGDGRILYCASVRNITQEKKARELADKNEIERMTKAAMLNAAFDSVFSTDMKGMITSVNRAALRIFGYDTVEDLLGKSIKVIVGGGHAARHDHYMSEYLRTRQAHVIGTRREVPARRKDGSEFPANLGIEFVEPDHGDPFFVAFVRDITEEKRAMELEFEKRAAEELLLNMLPEPIANRLKVDPGHLADHHSQATILFADIVGFTAMSSKMPAVDVVRILNDLFSRFDVLVDEYKLNKVKTIGDCYMVTSIPGRSDTEDSCASICHFAIEMLRELRQYNEQNPDKPLSLRVGINSGPVVAGVVGTKRFLYDIWGDTVNLASRMESTGLPGKIQVTEEVTRLVPKAQFQFESRGEVYVKGKGNIETWFLTERIQSGSAHRQSISRISLSSADRDRLRLCLSDDEESIGTTET